jgi:TetR/AcrR family transcriptional regulator
MPRGRSPGYDGQREQILAQAAELFARQGYAGTSMNAVAAACGVSKPALYHYWADKETLLAQICESHVARLQALVDEVAAQALPPEAHLRALITRFVMAYAGAQHHHRVLTEDVKFLSPEDRARINAGQRRVVEAFAQAVAALRPGSEAAGLHVPLAMLLFGMINWMFTWLRPDGALTHADMAPVVEALFLGGLPAVPLSAPAAAARSPRKHAVAPAGADPH